jgi:hypothetical protein
VVSNPIYFGPEARNSGGEPAGSGAHPPGAIPASTIAPFPWRIEKDPASGGTVRSSDHTATLDYRLGEGSRNSQFVAMATDIHQATFRAIDLSLSGDQPLRLSVQVRAADGARWGRSYYVDPAGTALHVPLADLRPIAGAAPVVESSAVTSILLVIDLTNAQPGRSGALRVLSSALSY